MGNQNKILSHLLSGRSDKNIKFKDIVNVLLKLNFDVRIKGDHHIFTKEGIVEIINIQPKNKIAKPYQVKQIRNIILSYKLGDLKMSKYEIIIYWSKDDNLFIAEVPELAGCMADGKTYKEALGNVEIIIEEWISTAKELNRPIPIPKGKLMFA